MAGQTLLGIGNDGLLGESDEVPVSDLLFDSQNPRLASGTNSDSQDDLLRVLWIEMAGCWGLWERPPPKGPG